MIYLTAFYVIVFASFVSATCAIIFYKISNKKNILSETLGFILGIIVSLILSYLMALRIFDGIWFYFLAIAGLALIVYVMFIKYSEA